LIRSLSFFGVLVFGRLLSLAGAPLALSPWTPVAYLWQDVGAALGLALLDYIGRTNWIGWSTYGLAVAYTAINVGIVRVLYTPLTLPMIRAAGGPLADSIRYYLTLKNVSAMAATIAAGILLPVVVRKKIGLAHGATNYLLVGAFLFAATGPYATSKIDTAGRYRNSFGALWPVHVARASNIPQNQKWRTSPFVATVNSRKDLHEYRGLAAGRNVVLILLESTASRYWPVTPPAVDPMPNLTAFSAEGIAFQNAYAVYPESIKGLLTVLCSKYPGFNVPPDTYSAIPCASLPQQLENAGYRTALFHSGRFMYLGMQAVIERRGFEILEDAGTIGGNVHSSFGVDDLSTVHRVLSWIDSLKRSERFFVTYLPVAGHHPYATPEEGPFTSTVGNEELTRYFNALHYGDRALGVLLDGLRARNLDTNTLFVIFGDHGEAFGQHGGNFGHTLFVYDENVHVPYLVVAPGLIRERIRVRDSMSLIDTEPSILDLLGLPIPAGLQGTSMLDPAPRMSLFFTDYSLGWLGLSDDCRKYLLQINAARSLLYDLCMDPNETIDLSSRQPERASAYRSLLERWITSVQ
jgi:hypothetical protein